MRAHLREILKEAQKLGFKFDGYDGRGHPRLVHDTGRRLSIAHTPSDVHAKQNALADMRRIMREEGDEMSATTISKEVWKPIIGLPNHELSNAGHVRKRLTHKMIRPTGHGAGLTVRLTDDRGRTHEKNVRKMVQTHFGHNPLLVVEPTLTQSIGERIRVRELANPISHQPKDEFEQMTETARDVIEDARAQTATQEKEEDMTIQASELGLPVEHVGLPRHEVTVDQIMTNGFVGSNDLKEPAVPELPTVRWTSLVYEGVLDGYEINSSGEILSSAGNVLKPFVNSGNVWVSLRRSHTNHHYSQIRLDLVMCRSFHGMRPSVQHGPEHINGDQLDCSASNLRWSVGFAVPVGSHMGKHRRADGRFVDDKGRPTNKRVRSAEAAARKRERDRDRYYRLHPRKAAAEPAVQHEERDVDQVVPSPGPVYAVPPTPPVLGAGAKDQVEVTSVTSYRYQGVEIIVGSDGSIDAPAMTMDNAAALAKILGRIGESR